MHVKPNKEILLMQENRNDSEYRIVYKQPEFKDYSGSKPSNTTPPPKPPKKKKRALKAFCVVLAALVLMCGTSFATIAIYTHMNGASGGSYLKTANTKIINTSSDGLTTIEIAEMVTPSVVGIECKQYVSSQNYGNFFNQFFGGNGRGQFGSSNESTLETTGTGSGFIVTKDGYIVTCAHVVADAAEIIVHLNNNTTKNASIVGMDIANDIAVIKIEGTDYTPVTLGNSDNLVRGEQVIAMGSPMMLELSGSITWGLISAIDRTITIDETEMTLIQHSASISPGNSGGPLINMNGEIIGINNAKVSGDDTEGIGFAIPMNSIKSMIEAMISGNYVSDTSSGPMLGISGYTVTAEMARQYGVPEGVYVADVDASMGAYASGVQPGDIITGINGTTITTMDELNEIKDKCKPGDTVTLNIYRSGLSGTLSVKLS